MEMRSEDAGSSPLPPTGLSAGDRLGRFEIVGPLGAGGMGSVYRARDTQLLRQVAIKVLPTAVWGDPDRQRRLEREARAAAGLNHPNVVAVHDFGVHDGIGFIVSELLEGETLREVMGAHPLPPRRAVDFAIQIASGLAAGHDRGIVHHDIKPENLFVTRESRIKILDFGLARVIAGGASDDPDGTLTLDRFPVARVAGTANYMSPEQARGSRTDHRSDMFSLGAVLFEMLEGFPPFRRGTPSETISAVLHEEPPPLWNVALELERIVRRCLEKLPEQRFQNARDVSFALQALPATALTETRKQRRWRFAMKAVLLLLAAGSFAGAAGYVAGWRLSPVTELGPIQRISRLTEFAGFEESPSISPDGRAVAFTAAVDGRRQIFVRLLAGGTPVQITTDPVDHQLPRWTPDGNSLVYFSPTEPHDAHGEIWRVPALGGSPRRIIESIGGADVSRSGRLVCFRLRNGKVELVTSSLDGDDQRVVVESPPGYHVCPRWSPDGRWIAFQRGDGLRYDIFVLPESGGAPRQLTHDRNIIHGLAWLPDGKEIVYGSSRGSTVPYLPALALWSVPVNGGTPRQLTGADVWYEQPDVHETGLISATRVRMRFDIWKFPFHDGPDRPGSGEQITRQTGQVLTPTAAPDGEHIAFLSDSGGHANLWVMSTRTGNLRQITFEDDPNVSVGVPVWSPDGRSIAFVSSRGRSGFDFSVWLVDPDGRNLRNLAQKGLGLAWSPDGRWLYYTEVAGGVIKKVASSGGQPSMVTQERVRNVIGMHGSTLYYVFAHTLVDGRPEFEIRAATPEDSPSRVVARISASRVPSWQIINPVLSPDGQWLALPLTDGFTTNIWALSTRNGEWRRVTDFADRATFIARRVSWSSDGRAIFAAVGEGDADIVVVETTTSVNSKGVQSPSRLRR